MNTTASEPLHEAWALASLMRARYGQNALNQARDEATQSKPDSETISIWRAVIECLSH